MQFRKLRLTGFKSFVQPTELSIEAGLTGVVGPNGCGKSNLVEALRWVMGENSAKGLRGGEMDDVIFAGTAARPAYDLAEVMVQIGAAELRLPGFDVDGDVELTRRIGRGVGSGYRLNGRELRARDVQLLFADAASGARSAAIVSQGQIGTLVEAKPAERRRLLEDAAGIAGLQARRREAELRLDAAETNLARVEDVLVTLDEQHERLTKQARQARRYREIGARYRALEARLLVGRWQRAEAECAAAAAALERAQEAVAAAERTVLAVRAERADAADALERLRRAAGHATTEAARMAERVAAATAAQAEREARRRRAEEQAAELERDGAAAAAALEDARRSLDRLETERRAIGDGQQEARTALARILGDAAQAAEELAAAEQRQRERLARLGELEARRRHLDEERSQLLHTRDALRVALEALPARMTALEADPAAASGPDRADEAENALAACEAERAAAEVQADLAERAREAGRSALRVADERLQVALREQAAREQRRQSRQLAAQTLEERGRDLEERQARLQARRAQVETKAAERRAARAALGLPALSQALEAAEAAAREADAALGARRRETLAAEQELAEARQAETALAAEIDRLQTETATLDELAPESPFARVIEAIEVDDGYADALGAALGDDLLASLNPAAPAHWAVARLSDEAGVSDPDPALPQGCVPLAAVVRAPVPLRRRLEQTGVLDAGSGDTLRPLLRRGQRLVSRAGALWRWDGFVRQPEALGPAAARLRHQARRRALGELLAELRCQAERTAPARSRREEALAAAQRRLADAEQVAGAAAARLQASATRRGEALAQDRALEVELGGLQEVHEQIAAEATLLDQAVSGLTAERAALAQEPDDDRAGAEDTGALAQARDEALAAELAAVQALDQARARVAEVRERSEVARAELDELRAAARTAEALEQERRFASERIEAERARLIEQEAAESVRAAELETAARQLDTQIGSAQQDLAQGDDLLAERRARHDATRTAEARLQGQLQAAGDRLRQIETEAAMWQTRLEAAVGRSREIEQRESVLAAERAALQDALAEKDGGERSGSSALAALEARAAEADQARAAAEAALAAVERRLELAEEERQSARERAVRSEAEIEQAVGLAAEAEAALRARPPQEPLDLDQEPPEPARLAELEDELQRLAASRERLGAVNLRAVDELAELELRLTTLRSERDELTQAIERLRRAIGALNREGRERLKAAFAEIEKHFEALFARLFGGGQARLALTDLEDPLAAGLELMASPPGKKLQSLSLLSGGEKALTALALIFAVFLSRPSPLCILDEVDAPLDDANVERFANLLDELARGTETRFLVITHHPLTMAHMDRLYGVTMLERGVSQLVSVDLGTALELRQTA